MFTLTFNTDNAAFDEIAATETARILRDVAKHIERGDLERSIMDSNGNRIGAYRLDEE